MRSTALRSLLTFPHPALHLLTAVALPDSATVHGRDAGAKSSGGGGRDEGGSAVSSAGGRHVRGGVRGERRALPLRLAQCCVEFLNVRIGF